MILFVCDVFDKLKMILMIEIAILWLTFYNKCSYSHNLFIIISFSLQLQDYLVIIIQMISFYLIPYSLKISS